MDAKSEDSYRGLDSDTSLQCLTAAIDKLHFNKNETQNTEELLESYLKRATIYFNLKKWTECIADCTAILQIDNRRLQVLFQRSICYAKLKKYNDAISDIQICLSCEPKRTEFITHFQDVIVSRRILQSEIEGQKGLQGAVKILVDMKELPDENCNVETSLLDSLKRIRSECTEDSLDDLGDHGEVLFECLRNKILQENVTLRVEQMCWSIYEHSLSIFGTNEMLQTTNQKEKNKQSLERIIVKFKKCWDQDQLQNKIHQHLSKSISDDPETGDAYCRSNCVQSLLGILKFVSSIHNLKFVTLVSICMERIEANNVRLASISSLLHTARRESLLPGPMQQPLSNSNYILKCLENLLPCLIETNLYTVTHLSIIIILQLLSDKNRPENELTDMDEIVDSLLGPYFDSKDDNDMWAIGLEGLHCVFAANRDCAKTFVSSKELLPLLLQFSSNLKGSKREQDAAVKCVLQCMQFSIFRSHIITGSNVEDLSDRLNRLKGSVRASATSVVAYLTVQDPEKCSEILKKVDFLKILGELEDEYVIGKTTNKEQNTEFAKSILETYVILSLHGAFKSMLLDKKQNSKISKLIHLYNSLIEPNSDTSLNPLFCNIFYNLVRSNEDKESSDKKKSGLDLDESQMAELRAFNKSLPKLSQAAPESETDFGSSVLAEKMHGMLLQEKLVEKLSKMVLNTKSKRFLPPVACVRAIRLLCRKQENRKYVVQQGGLRALLQYCSHPSVKPHDQRDLRQAISQISFSINPTSLSYRDQLDTINHLLALLHDSYELYQYEAALGITNLMSSNEDVREGVWRAKGWEALKNLFFSDNEMVRAAAMEGWCNLSACSNCKEWIATLKPDDSNLKILFGFCNEKDNLRAQKAAAGALATFATSPDCLTVLTQYSKLENLNDALQESDDQDFILRCTLLIECMLRAPDIKKEQREKLEKIKRQHSTKFQNPALLTILKKFDSA